MTYGENHIDNKDINIDSVKNPTERQESKDTFWDVEKKIENILETIKKSLGQTTLMFLRIWILHPEISKEMGELKEKFDKSKQEMSWEFTSGILRQIRELLNKYWNEKEKKITQDLWECLYELQQIHSKRNSIKGSEKIMWMIDGLWDIVFDDMSLITWTEDVASNSNTRRNPGWGPFIYQWPYTW